MRQRRLKGLSLVHGTGWSSSARNLTIKLHCFSPPYKVQNYTALSLSLSLSPLYRFPPSLIRAKTRRLRKKRRALAFREQMANPNLPKIGALRLPPGFRFHPTDEELILQYLKRKVFSVPLPAAIIPEIDLGKYDPWDLPGVGEQERYFFYLRAAKYPNGRRVNRAMGSGYWKITGKEKPIVASKSNQVVGMKKALVFYHGKPPAGGKTGWFMHEYCLAGAGGAGDAGFCCFGKTNDLAHSKAQCSRDWVLCRIFMKRRAAEEEEEGARRRRKPERLIRLFNFVSENERDGSSSSSSFSSASSSGLSCVTESNGEVSSRTSSS